MWESFFTEIQNFDVGCEIKRVAMNIKGKTETHIEVIICCALLEMGLIMLILQLLILYYIIYLPQIHIHRYFILY